MENTMMTSVAKRLCEKLQFLIGVPKQYIEGYEGYTGLLIDIRRLCKLRSMIMFRFLDINAAFKENHSLYGVEEVRQLLDDLVERGIFITEYPGSLSRQIMELNRFIDERVAALAEDFSPIPAEWIRELFHMPEGDTVEGVRNTCIKYQKYRNYYPNQRYINWNFAEISEEKRAKNLLGSDEHLLAMLEEVHASKSRRLMDFVDAHEGTVVVVNCENSDAQRILNSLHPVLSDLAKIILIDDEHPNVIWQELFEALTVLQVPVEHVKIGRLKVEKSLTDFKMVTKTCEEYYQNRVRNFVLASSDSDIWALISSLPEAEVMVLAEKCKSGDVLIDALTQHQVPYAFMEDLQTDSTELMDKVILREIRTLLEKKYFEPRRVVPIALSVLNLYPDEASFERYVKEAEVLIEAIYGSILPGEGDE